MFENPESTAWHTSQILTVNLVQQVEDETRQDKYFMISVGKSGYEYRQQMYYIPLRRV